MRNILNRSSCQRAWLKTPGVRQFLSYVLLIYRYLLFSSSIYEVILGREFVEPVGKNLSIDDITVFYFVTV